MLMMCGLLYISIWENKWDCDYAIGKIQVSHTSVFGGLATVVTLIAGVAVEMHRQNGLCALRNSRLHFGSIEVVVFVRLHKNRGVRYSFS